jgi:thymidylate kinase
MKLILIDGGPASGKNTLGELLVDKLLKIGEKAVLLDLDAYVEKYNPKWIWDSEREKERDQLQARVDLLEDIRKSLRENATVFVIGERFLSRDDVRRFLEGLEMVPSVFIYHLSVPFILRQQRLHERGPHSLIDLKKDQEDRDAVTEWPGCVYENIHDPEEDTLKLLSLIQRGEGEFKF